MDEEQSGWKDIETRHIKECDKTLENVYERGFNDGYKQRWISNLKDQIEDHAISIDIKDSLIKALVHFTTPTNTILEWTDSVDDCGRPCRIAVKRDGIDDE